MAVPELRDLPLVRWGDELRRDRLARRSRIRLACTAIAALTAGALFGTLLWPTRPLLVWNTTASSPVGLYHVSQARGISAGDMVIAWPPAMARRLAVERRYLPANVPLVKKVAAAEGDRVCAVGHAVFVNGRFLAPRRGEDLSGRPLPWWTGCVDLQSDDLFLLLEGAPDSFDGRYFGLTRRQEVIGKARLIWRA